MSSGYGAWAEASDPKSRRIRGAYFATNIRRFWHIRAIESHDGVPDSLLWLLCRSPTIPIMKGSCLHQLTIVAFSTILASCVVEDDEPPSPEGDSGGPTSAEICALAIDAIAATCSPPTSPFVEFSGGGSDYTIIDDPAAAGGVGVLGGFLINANAQVSADYYGRIIVNNDVCQVACIYECLAADKDLCSVAENPGVSPSCFLCSDDISEEGCATIINACMGEGSADSTGGEADSSTGIADETSADSSTGITDETSATASDSTDTSTTSGLSSGTTG